MLYLLDQWAEVWHVLGGMPALDRLLMVHERAILPCVWLAYHAALDL